MCQEARRNSPSVADCSPTSRCIATTSRIASSSTARSSSAVIRPAASSPRGVQQRGRAQQAADVVGAERRRRPSPPALVSYRCLRRQRILYLASSSEFVSR